MNLKYTLLHSASFYGIFDMDLKSAQTTLLELECVYHIFDLDYLKKAWTTLLVLD